MLNDSIRTLIRGIDPTNGVRSVESRLAEDRVQYHVSSSDNSIDAQSDIPIDAQKVAVPEIE